MTEKESLQIIREMITTSKGNIRDNSFFYLLWGWLVLVASLSHYTMIRMGVEQSYLVWPVLMGAGFVISIVAGFRIGKRSVVITIVDKAIIYLWWAFTVVLIIIFLMAGLQKISWPAVYPIIIAMYGMGTFVSGGILKFRPLILGGIASWVISVVAFFVAPVNVLLLTALSIVIAYLVPGYILKSKETNDV